MEAEDHHSRGRTFGLGGVHDGGHSIPSLGDEAYQLHSCPARRRTAERVIDVGPECCFRTVG